MVGGCCWSGASGDDHQQVPVCPTLQHPAPSWRLALWTHTGAFLSSYFLGKSRWQPQEPSRTQASRSPQQQRLVVSLVPAGALQDRLETLPSPTKKGTLIRAVPASKTWSWLSGGRGVGPMSLKCGQAHVQRREEGRGTSRTNGCGWPLLPASERSLRGQ